MIVSISVEVRFGVSHPGRTRMINVSEPLSS